MVGVAQRFKAPGCGPGDRGFESLRPPQKCAYSSADKSTGLRNRGSWVRIPLGALFIYLYQHLSHRPIPHTLAFLHFLEKEPCDKLEERRIIMVQELGKIEKPDAASFKQGRKLLLVPLIYLYQDAPSDYTEKYELYWKQVAEHVVNLEAKIGTVSQVYHESISLGGDDGLKIMEKLNPKSCQIARQKCQDGAKLEVMEDKELAEETIDWERCLFIGFLSDKVARKVSELYVEASRKRYEHISKKIDETLKADETAILFIREGHLLQFPQDIEVFSVAPPALDELHRWLRDRTSAKEPEDDSQSES